jgi:hypothetical protein
MIVCKKRVSNSNINSNNNNNNKCLFIMLAQQCICITDAVRTARTQRTHVLLEPSAAVEAWKVSVLAPPQGQLVPAHRCNNKQRCEDSRDDRCGLCSKSQASVAVAFAGKRHHKHGTT